MDEGGSVVVLAHNIRSLWNVGSIFRTCDCFAVEKLLLSGYTASPPRPEITKVAIGAEALVPWEHAIDPALLLHSLGDRGYRLVSLEQSPRSVPIAAYTWPLPLCLIVGHEVLGVPGELEEMSDDVVEIPLYGHKESLNVAVALGVALSHLRTRHPLK